jgi:hypothetical protein
VGGGGSIGTSADGTNWHPAASGTSEELFAVSPFPSGVIAVGGVGVTVSSGDGGSHWSTPR